MRTYDQHVIIDLEWTPIPKRYKEERKICRHEIIQIGAVLLDSDYRKVSVFSTYVSPSYAVYISPNVTKLTGITDIDLLNAPSFEEAMEMLCAWIGNGKRTRVYSWSDTDLNQIENECFLKDIPVPSCMRRWMDFQRVYGKLLKCKYQLSLKNAVTAVNGRFSALDAHSAIYDAMATAELLMMVTSKAEFEKNTRHIRELLVPQKCSNTIGELYGERLAGLLG